MKEIKYKNEKDEEISISNLGFFTIPDLEKEYIMYGITEENNDMGKVLLGEVVRDGNDIKVLGILESEKDIFEHKFEHSLCNDYAHKISIILECSNGIVFENHSILYSHFSSQMIEYMPPNVYKKVRADILSPLGNFICFDKIEQDKKYPNIILHYLKYENLGLKIRYVFHEDKIHGLWLSYYE